MCHRNGMSLVASNTSWTFIPHAACQSLCYVQPFLNCGITNDVAMLLFIVETHSHEGLKRRNQNIVGLLMSSLPTAVQFWIPASVSIDFNIFGSFCDWGDSKLSIKTWLHWMNEKKLVLRIYVFIDLEKYLPRATEICHWADFDSKQWTLNKLTILSSSRSSAALWELSKIFHQSTTVQKICSKCDVIALARTKMLNKFLVLVCHCKPRTEHSLRPIDHHTSRCIFTA